MGINLPHDKRTHEVEACFLSNKSMTTILSTKLSYEYLSRRKFYPGWFDVSLALANNMIDNPIPYYDKRMKLHPEGFSRGNQFRNYGKLHSFMMETERKALHVHGVPPDHQDLYEIHRIDNTINKQFIWEIDHNEKLVWLYNCWGRTFWLYFCQRDSRTRQNCASSGSKRSYWRELLYRKNRRYRCSQIWATYIPYKQQRSMELCQSIF